MQFFQAFGVDWKSLIAQFVNFAILMFILYKLAYKPLLKFMKDRTEAIARGVENAKQAKELLSNTKSEEEKILLAARKEAAAIVESARAAAEKQAAGIIAQAKNEVIRVVADGKEALAIERSNMLSQVKKDVINMVVASTEKILQGVVNEEVDQAWLKQKLAKVK